MEHGGTWCMFHVHHVKRGRNVMWSGWNLSKALFDEQGLIIVNQQQGFTICVTSYRWTWWKEWFGLKNTSRPTTYTCVHARKCRISYLNFLEFCQKYFHRVPPSRPNSLCKNLKKWEKNARKSWKWCFFREKAQILTKYFCNKSWQNNSWPNLSTKW